MQPEGPTECPTTSQLPPTPAVPFPKPAPFRDSHWSCRGRCHPHTHKIKTIFLGTVQHCGGCDALSDNWRKLYKQFACIRPSVRTSAFPWDHGGYILQLTKSPAMFRGTRTGNLQSPLTHLGLCYHLLSFKMNIRRQKQSFLLLHDSPSHREQGGIYKKEQDLLSPVP